MEISTSKFVPRDGEVGDGGVDIDMPEAPKTGTIEEGLGINTVVRAQIDDDPEVQGFLDATEGRTPQSRGDEEGGDLKKLVRELTEQNKHLASKLGQQGNEVVGPLRKQVEELQQQLQQIQQQQSTPRGGSEDLLRDTIRNLYGPQADPTDDVLRFHAQAHINAANSLGDGIQRNIVGPLERRIEQLQQQLAASEGFDGIPRNVQRQFAEQYPGVDQLPRETRESLMRAYMDRQQGSRSSSPTVPYQNPAYYVEGSTPTAPMKSSTEAALREFDRMSVEKQERALGAMLAKRGASALGL